MQDSDGGNRNGPKIRRLYYSTQEVCDETGLDPASLRQLETKFSSFSPIKKGGRKKYSPTDLKIAKRIKQYKNLGLTDDRIRLMLTNPGQADKLPTPPLIRTHRIIEEVKSTLYDVLEIIEKTSPIT